MKGSAYSSGSGLFYNAFIIADYTVSNGRMEDK
jgi:hypothetical protein